jgi:hypothetical protein
MHAEGGGQERDERQRHQRSAGKLASQTEHREALCRTIQRESSEDP